MLVQNDKDEDYHCCIMEKSVFRQRDLLNIDAIEDGKALDLKRLKSLILSKPFAFMPFEK